MIAIRTGSILLLLLLLMLLLVYTSSQVPIHVMMMMVGSRLRLLRMILGLLLLLWMVVIVRRLVLMRRMLMGVGRRMRMLRIVIVVQVVKVALAGAIGKGWSSTRLRRLLLMRMDGISREGLLFGRYGWGEVVVHH